jgi:gamma-glutamyltranspeptidase/glutathione hydrolase
MICSALIVDKHEVVTSRGMVTAMHPQAARVGLQILQKGGNAVDAAVGTAFALGVVEPSMSGAAGHGAMVIQTSDNTTEIIDFTTRAPAAAHENLYVEEEPTSNTIGYRAIPVPGATAGLMAALERHGTMEPEDVLAPAIRLADEGFEVDWYVSMMITAHMRKLIRFPESRKTFLVDGIRPPAPRMNHAQPGDILVQKNLARTYQIIGEKGAAGFYHGDIAQCIDADMQDHRGLLTKDDLASYQPEIVKDGLVSHYRDWEIVGVPGASATPSLFHMLNMLEGYDLATMEHNGADYLHLITEVQRRAYQDRFAFMADPQIAEVPYEMFLSKDYGKRCREALDPRNATPQITANDLWDENQNKSFSPTPTKIRDEGCTTHFSVIDRERNIVSCTTTHGHPFGSSVVIRDTGLVMLNNMYQFDTHPGRVNSIAPGKHPVWNGTPIIVRKEGQPVLALGAPGALRIISAVMQVLVNILDFKMGVQEAISRPRIHCEGPETLVDDRVPEAVRHDLRARGHQIVDVTESFNSVNFARPNGISIDWQRGELRAGVDQWRVGTCVGY